MEKQDYDEIEQLIGYEFDNRLLLQQAFTRKSYTNETHDGDNNEVLEFIGDKVLDLAVVRALSDYYGEINSRDEFACDINEGKLTELKKRFVESKMLAHRIDELGFAQYLIMGKGDRKNNAQDDPHVKEDLFEAILGAVAIDSDWDMQAMQDAAELMLDIDYYLDNGFDGGDNYVSLVQQWCQKEKGELPGYRFYNSLNEYRCHYYGLQVGRRRRMEDGEGEIVCELHIDGGEPFVGFGHSKSEARMIAAELVYHYLDEEGLLFTMADEIDEPSIDKAISQLQELAQKGYYSMPEYSYEEKHDRNGNPYWLCRCEVREYSYWYQSKASTKKEAKRRAAYDMLMSILNADGNNNDDDWNDDSDDDDWDD